jgi:polyhydroxybutyrate depolymerase
MRLAAPRLFTVVVTGWAALLAAGCGGKAVAANGSGAALGPGAHERQLQSGGRERYYRIHVPPRYSKDRPMPLVVNFHPGAGNAAQQEKDSRMSETSDAKGFIVVYPEGSGPFRHRLLSWNAGFCCGYAQDKNVDDVQFTRDLLADVQRVVSVDPRRVYATGYSNGAMMAHRVGCELADRVAAIAAVAGPNGTSACRPSRPVPVLAIHGTADEHAPYRGGPVKALLGGETRQYPAIPDTVKGWAERDRCTGAAQVTLKQGAVTCETQTQCAGGASVTLCTVQGGGHTWPGGNTTMSESRLGPINRDIQASDVIWDFFARYALP